MTTQQMICVEYECEYRSICVHGREHPYTEDECNKRPLCQYCKSLHEVIKHDINRKVVNK